MKSFQKTSIGNSQSQTNSTRRVTTYSLFQLDPMKIQNSWKLVLLAFFFILTFSACEKELETDEPGYLVQKTVDEDPTLPSLSINGTMLHAETFGNPDSSIIIFLHGGPGADYRNGLKASQLADDGYFVVFYDQRGSGLSRRHDKDSYSIDHMINDLDAVIQHYRMSPNQKVFLFGHSWGAMLAGGYIDLNPSVINGAVFAEPGGFNNESLDEYNEGAKAPEVFKEATSDIVYMDQFLTGSENDHEILDYKISLMSSFSYQEGNAEGIEGPSPYWRYGAVLLNKMIEISDEDGFDFTQNLNQYEPEVLFIYGENNKVYGLEFAEKEASNFNNYRTVQIDGTGHDMIYFKWNLVHPIVLNYFNSLN